MKYVGEHLAKRVIEMILLTAQNTDYNLIIDRTLKLTYEVSSNESGRTAVSGSYAALTCSFSSTRI